MSLNFNEIIFCSCSLNTFLFAEFQHNKTFSFILYFLKQSHYEKQSELRKHHMLRCDGCQEIRNPKIPLIWAYLLCALPSVIRNYFSRVVRKRK